MSSRHPSKSLQSHAQKLKPGRYPPCFLLLSHPRPLPNVARMADLARTVQRWKDSATLGQQRYTEGIQSSQVDVVARAVAAQPKMLANVTQAVTSGRWARGLQNVGTAGWKQQSLAKANNYATGIAAGGDKYQQAMTTWLPIIDSAAASVHGMPNTSFQDSIARMTAFSTALHNAKLAR